MSTSRKQYWPFYTELGDSVRAETEVLRSSLGAQNHVLSSSVAHHQTSCQESANCVSVFHFPGFKGLQILQHFVRAGKGISQLFNSLKSKIGHVTEVLEATGWDVLTINSSGL